MSKTPQEADIAFIRELAELLRERDLGEIEVSREYGENDSLSVRVSRQTAVPAPSSMAAPHFPAAPGTVALPAIVPVAASNDPADHPGVVPSPMVGTAYLQAEPDAPPFVRVGDIIAEGQTILIIEAMKTMNQIPAPRSGQVKRILIDDGSPVEFGAPLIILE